MEVRVADSRLGFLSNGGIHKGGGGYSMGRMESIMAGGGLPLLQCVRTRINRRNQSRTSIGLRESPLSP